MITEKIVGKDMVRSITKAVIGVIALILVIEIVTAFVWPVYNVWASEKKGQAELAQAIEQEDRGAGSGGEERISGTARGRRGIEGARSRQSQPDNRREPEEGMRPIFGTCG